MEIRFETDSKKGSWTIPTISVLESLKLSPKDVVDVTMAYYAMSNYPYEEVNVARCSHPCEGSIGFFINTKDSRYLVEDIFYYDYNLKKNHYNGLPHWNHERRLSDGTQTWYQDTDYVEDHGIPDSPSIIWQITDKGSTVNEKEIKRVPIDQVREHK
jgi:hypothetical protein